MEDLSFFFLTSFNGSILSLWIWSLLFYGLSLDLMYLSCAHSSPPYFLGKIISFQFVLFHFSPFHPMHLSPFHPMHLSPTPILEGLEIVAEIVVFPCPKKRSHLAGKGLFNWAHVWTGDKKCMEKWKNAREIGPSSWSNGLALCAHLQFPCTVILPPKCTIEFYLNSRHLPLFSIILPLSSAKYCINWKSCYMQTKNYVVQTTSW